MTTHVRRFSAGAASVAAVLVAASAAWACSPSASVDYCGSPSEGAAGTRVAVCLQGFEAGRPVQIRWGATDGPLLKTATAEGKGSSVVVPIPANASVGRNLLVFAFSYTDGATDTGSTRQLQFNVLPTVTTDQVVTVDPVTTQTNGVSSGTEPDAALPAPAPSPTSSSATGAVTTVADATPIPALQTIPVSANPAAVRQAGRTVFGGSVAPEVPAATAPAEADAPAVPARTASGDLWSGFATGTDAPAFGLGSDTPAKSDSSTGLLAALFGAGLMALFAGFGVAELSRRRALVRVGGDS